MRIRRAAATIIALTMVMLSIPARGAGAMTATEIRGRIDSLKKTLDGVASELHAAEHEYAQLTAAIERHRAALAAAEGERAQLRDAIDASAARLYMTGSLASLDILAGDGLATYIDRMSYLEQVRSAERGLLEEVRALQERAATESALLRSALSRAEKVRSTLRSRESTIQSQLSEMQRLYNFLQDVASRGVVRASRSGYRGMICPIVGYTYVSNNFGDPRPGGPHQGVDLRAQHGQEVRAVLPGTIVETPYGSWWGIGVVLRDLAGTEWWYAHLSSESVSVGQRVTTGSVLGRAGCTGTCYGTHLHFEWHPGGGSARDPYGIVAGVC